MKKSIKLWTLISLTVVLVALLMSLCTVVFAAETPEATLTVTPAGGTAETFSGTYSEMQTKVENFLKEEPTVKTEYVITINSNISIPHGSFTGNSNCSVTIDLNGFTIDVTAMNNNLFSITGDMEFNIDGADAKGNRGKIINGGHSGGIVYLKNLSATENTVVNISDVEYTATNMSQGYSTGKYKDQPMCNIAIGTTNMKNVKMVFTGEKSTAVEGSVGGSDITKMIMRFIQAGGTAKVTLDGCEFINTDTKGIDVRGVDLGGSASMYATNTTFTGKYGVNMGTSASASLYNCDVYGYYSPFNCGGKLYVTDSVVRSDTGILNASNPSNSAFISSGDGETVIYTKKALNKEYNLGGFKLQLEASDGEEDKYTVVSDGTKGAYLLVSPKTAAPSYYTGTYQEMHTQLASSLKDQTAPDVRYDLVILKDAAYTKHVDLAMNTALTEGSYSRVTVDLNGYTMTASGMNNNLYTVKGTATSTLVMTVDGSNGEGKRGTLICTDLAGALFFTRANDSLNVNTIATAKDINLIYTNMAQGYGNDSQYPNQQMIHLPAGKTVYLTNVKLTYTGEDAFAMEGKDLTQMSSSMVAANGVKELIIEGCEFIDTNTKGITTHGISASGSNSKVTVKNTKISATYGVICSEKTACVEIIDSDISGSKATYKGTGTIKVTDTVSRVPGASAFASGTADSLFFIYGRGKNVIYSESALSGDYEIQSGYTLASSDGVYFMKPDTSVEATLCVNPYGSKPTFTTGDYNTLHVSLGTVKPTVKTEYTLVLNKDALYSTAKSFSVNSNAVIKIYLEGHTLNVTVNANIYQFTGSPTIIIDGSDKNGTVGKIHSTGLAGAIFYPQNNGTNNDAVMKLSNVEITYTNMAQGYASESKYPNQPMANLPAGDITFENVKVTYTGADIPEGTDVTDMHTSFINVGGDADLKVINCEFNDVNTKGIETRGFLLNGSAKVKVINSKFKSVAGIVSAGAFKGQLELIGCELSADEILFNGPATVIVTDSVLKTAKSFSNSSANVILMYGTGKTEILVSGEGNIDGVYVVEDGYLLCPKGKGHYIVSDGEGLSTISMPAVFGNGMVIQRNKPINIYGYCATEGAEVKVTFDGKSKTVTVVDGRWCATFDAMSAKKGLTLSVEQLDVEMPVVLSFNDIAIGEIWVISGQSNANYEVYKLEDAAEYIANADNFDNIKIYAEKSRYSVLEDKIGVGAWYNVTSELLSEESIINGEVSAYAYVMATRLAMELDPDVTVAIMDLNYNGSGVMSWISEECYREYIGNDNSVTRLEAYQKFYKEYGRMPRSADELSLYIDRAYANVICADYNAMVASKLGYNVAGVIWVQGEGNSSMGYQYKKCYNAMTETFRRTFVDEKLPFFVIQLHPFSDGVANDFRDAQYEMVDADPYSWLVSAANGGVVFNTSDFTYNNGDTSLVHPSRKSPTAHALADSILCNVYKHPDYVKTEAPMIEKVEVSGDKIVITLDTEVKTELGNEALGFEIAGADGTFVKAEATVSGNKITVSAEAVTAPVEVRYGYGYTEIELSDGTRIEYVRKNVVEYNSDHMLLNTIDGKQYEFVPDTDRVVRTKLKGNVVSKNGHLLPIFKVSV